MAWLGALLLRAWASTWRVRPPGAGDRAFAEAPVVFACWHGELMPLLLLFRDRGILTLASQSRDGGRVAALLARLGYGVLRGSSSRGARSALRGLRSALQTRSICLTVDGPRGPRHVAKPGAVGLARVSGRPLWAARAACWPALTLSTWDRFVIPLPFARIDLRFEPVLAEEEALAAALGD